MDENSSSTGIATERTSVNSTEISDTHLPTSSVVERWIIPAVCVAGYIGNGLIIMVMLRKTFRTSSMGILLISLAVVDSANLLIPYPFYWLYTSGIVIVSNYNNIACKVFSVYSFLANTLASWVLVIITMERCASVVRPFDASRLFSRKRVAIGFLITLILAILLHLHLLWNYTLLQTPDGPLCDKTPQFLNSFYFPLHIWADLILASLVPFAIITILNCIILWKLHKSSKIRKSSGKRGGKSQRSMVIMLLATSFTFIILTMPLMIEQLTTPTAGMPSGLFFEVAVLCLSLNNAINFYLYCISGSRFREELKSMFCGDKGKKAPQFSRSDSKFGGAKKTENTDNKTSIGDCDQGNEELSKI